MAAYSSLGAKITVVAPEALLPDDVSEWPVAVSNDLDAVLPDLDVVGLLRIQKERITDDSLISINDYIDRYGMTESRADKLRTEVVITHPGPVNRGIEIADAVLDKTAKRIGATTSDQRGSGSHGSALQAPRFRHRDRLRWIKKIETR